MTTITALPPAPSRADPLNFSAEADAFLGALPAFGTETNAVAAEVIANRDLTEGYKNSAITQVGLAADQVALAAVQVGLAEDQVALAAVQVGLAADQVTLAQGQVTLATNQANAAAASALTAVNSPSTSATSTSSVVVGTGAKTLTIQTGKAFQVGQWLNVAYTTDALNNYMVVKVTAYDSGTGVLDCTSMYAIGSGTYTAWTLSLSAPILELATQAEMEAGIVSAAKTVSPLLVKQAITAQATPLLQSASQAEMEAGALSTNRLMSPLNVAQAISAQSIREVATPVNSSPANAATNIDETPTLSGGSYYEIYGNAQYSYQFQISLTSDFSSIFYDTNEVVTASNDYVLPASILNESTTYYWRNRRKSSGRLVWSNWSTPTSFTTMAYFVSYIATPAATPAIGAAFEGGFYAGMIWNELVQSSTSTTIGTGSKAFTVPDMTGAPIVYAGQALEVRSRANPANKMIGTVTEARGLTLTLNITSVAGSGTFTDWSIMSKYRIIVAPKASGEVASGYAWKNATTAGPAATQTLTEGWKATEAMKNAGTSTVYPAAHWSRNLNIGSRTDWYLPARDELEVCYRNLKPTTSSNNTGTRTNLAYTNLGSVGDSGTLVHGTNSNSSPTGAAYTAGSPAQTAVSAFITGSGAEAFSNAVQGYWTSTEASTSNATTDLFDSGTQTDSTKTATNKALRAVRRSII